MSDAEVEIETEEMSREALARSGSQKETEGEAHTAGGDPKAQWSSQSYLLEEISQQFTLPQVVKCNAMSILTRRDQPIPINMASPLLLYDQRTIRKLLARNVLSDPRNGRYTETDETIVIPADYEGHFLRLKSRTVKDNTVHRSIGSLAVNHAPAFVNLTTLNTFQLASNGSNRYPPLEFAPGNVFIIERPIRGSTRVKSGNALSSSTSSSLLRRPSGNSTMTTRQELHYLKCRDERNVEILVPMSHPGEFVEVLPNQFNSGNADGNNKLSMPTEDIISTQKFPLLARYVYGGGRPRLTSFSGLLTMLDSFEETSVVGCVLDGASFILMEIPQSSPLLFQIALNSHDLFALPVVRHALRVCETNGSTFASDLKFKFKFAQRILHHGHKHTADDPPSATNSARMGVTQTYLYL